jgi:hypothetical protein
MASTLALLAATVGSSSQPSWRNPHSGPPACPSYISFCSSSSSGACVVDQDVIWQEAGWCSLNSTGSLLVRPNVTIACTLPAYDPQPGGWQGQQCAISLNFTDGIVLDEGARVIASSVRLQSQGVIDVRAGASVRSDGLGRCGNHPPLSGDEERGAGHGGYGGSCTQFLTGGVPFGDATEPEEQGGWDATMYGGGTTSNNGAGQGKQTICCGGGFVRLQAGAGIVVEGSVSADAQTPCAKAPPPSPPSHARRTSQCPQCAWASASASCANVSGASAGTVALHAQRESTRISC